MVLAESENIAKCEGRHVRPGTERSQKLDYLLYCMRVILTGHVICKGNWLEYRTSIAFFAIAYHKI